ncbi:cell division protein FtsZ [Ammoniphilus sp. 3BR4]|uniref:cell division protein FtsZ n=1 Tax=Ammoniphilus sp. 3BR4 TaxID=3158265 RepID=UPI003466EFB9
MKSIDSLKNLGALKALLSRHVLSSELESEFSRFPSQAIVGLGQGGGRIAAELSRFGFPTFLLNSSKSDMNEHRGLIPDERRIETKHTGYPALEGTDKNAQLGYEIAVENKDTYKLIAVEQDIQNAEFVWVCVSLGGGTGNGALKVALSYLSQIRSRRAIPTSDGNKIPLGVICSLPSKDEKGSAFRKNALAGINVLSQLMRERKIGSVLVMDNQKISDYYNDPLTTTQGMEIDARSYSNMVVASTLFEICTLPLLGGRSVFDKTELLSTLSTPGWLSISKMNDLTIDNEDSINFEAEITRLFKDNEVLADYRFDKALAGAIAVIYPEGKNISPKIADAVYGHASELLNTKVNQAISKSRHLQEILFYGLAVVAEAPVRIHQLLEEKNEWESIEEEQRKAQQEIATAGLDEFDDFFTTKKKLTHTRQNIGFDDLVDDIEGSQKAADLMDLDDLDDNF